MLSPHRLLLLQELRRRGSVHAVSEALSFSPSTVSQQLKVLETEAGARLIERVGRGVRLTREGEILAEHAPRILGEIERAEAAVAAVRAVAEGDVRVAALQTASLAFLPRVIRMLESTTPHPRMLVSRIAPDRALGALAAREFDIVLGEEYPGLPVSRQKGIDVVPLLDDPLVLVAPEDVDPPHAPADLGARMPWVMEPVGSDARAWCLGLCRELGVEPEVQFESDDLLVQMRLVETGNAVAVLPRLLLDSERPRLRRIDLPGRPVRRVFAAHRSGSQLAPAIDAVLTAFMRAIAD